ncbi:MULTISPECIES: hypothetical protein [Nocardia]|uniref:hypothetical protein n=1 Tax=Nocardia TaxID=1817 RepID=UPI0007EAD154|nr:MULTISPECIES: hypothetical protein [Nocardia]MBF6272943.1 hypothetical protein [Nocardia nova]OBA44135.1 hypothetical protein A5789_09700 [Nocardia sp. 852002-51101_SCH5132738]OBB43971.1 hypothetical protein A5748_28245 [Nocardia sp. 852002-51244_SCH5132740]OBF64926.1 hypothetical protein A9X06_08475 [Mycobacterium sp. 852002-51759_SCH5129042]
MTTTEPTPDPARIAEQTSTSSPGSDRVPGPNAAQAALLRRLRDIADGLARMQETGRLGGEFGHFPSELWHDYLDDLHDRADALTELGRAGGIPSPWLDYARGHTASAQVPERWPGTDVRARAELIAAVGEQTRELGHIAAVHAAYRSRVATGPEREQDAFAEMLGQRWDRIATVVALLKPVGAEREQIWPDVESPTRLAAFAQPIRDIGPAELARRWHSFRTTPDAAVSAHAALADYGDLTWDPDRELVPTPQSLIAQISAVLHPGRSVDKSVGAGAAIDADIAAALPDVPREFLPEIPTPDPNQAVAPALDTGPEP